jgi:CspA family cold shock protein
MDSTTIMGDDNDTMNNDVMVDDSMPGSDESKQTGTVDWFDPTKGYGFIRPDGNGEGEQNDIFVHINNIADRMPLQDNERVAFNTEETEKGLSATNVTREGDDGMMA